ncbi:MULTISPECIES: universal stress protein [unclassified Rhodococcus (in: high G+C Gram-positive bacteria)]|jgi:nucleotide-binding universal stress UspA family protein|uniref:universal stress protein n=1 Tax=unclassified Rhodococcus (in: high G+C Gram-positive bacteria) TaxID=192944 RepID=UPI0007BB4928|nr:MULTISPECIES: universal stress protein [unclassified Rhodococcus (in: high G+C Gram-positive bacteria)]KZF10210.1 universal stress protein UspA [Rhodococcus sp. EPR-147]KZF10942.1 universal stress protein UspA [Rhodococcus sp. EPR-279]MDV7989535.1 universal stress protein [Rhodococcus sp. IEGM 1374]OZE33010.1 universal stress protein [Rhodococcus sp. 05-2254-4]OZE44095.1 universal stress protein [Rhodococcus sp. 05-2254-3]
MRLIVGYQATPSGADGIALGATLARSLQASLDICLVLPQERPVPSKAPVEAGYDDILIDRATGWLDEALTLVPEDVQARAHLLFDESFAQGLLDAVREFDAYMIVVGAAGDGLLGRHSIGTVTSDLLHVAHVPLALAPRGYRHSPPQRIREITCAIGNRPGAAELIEAATDLSVTAELPLRLLSLVSADEQSAQGQGGLAKAEEVLRTVQAELPAGSDVQLKVAEGSGIEKAASSLDWHDGDVLMVGSSRLAQPHRLFLGSVAAKMLRVVPVPMIVVPREAGDE